MKAKIAGPVKLLAIAPTLTVLSTLLPARSAEACSRVFVNDNNVAKIAVRSMDLPLHLPERPRLAVFPRGMERDCTRSVLPGVKAKIEGLGTKPLRWTSKYGNVVMVGFDGGTSDGINEHGLAAHMLTLLAVEHEPKDDRPELSDALWVQYVLDNFTSVKEVVQAHRDRKFRLVAVTVPELGLAATLGSHLAVEDPTGDSAIFEYVAGKLVIHHGAQYTVMTNDPPMDQMLKRMRKYQPFGGKEPLPGDCLEGEYRYARLAAYSKLLPQPKNRAEALAGALSLMRIAQIPFRDPEKDKATEPEALWRGCQTNWVSAADLTNKVYYVNSSLVPSLGWVDLKDLNFDQGSAILYLNPHDPRPGGDLTKRLKKWTRP